MTRKTRLIVNVVSGFVLLAVIGLMTVTRNEAHNLITAPLDDRNLPEETPADYDLPLKTWRSSQPMD